MADAILFYSVSDEFGCFSNFAPSPIRIAGKTWPTTEHYFQAMKYPHDPERQGWIRKAGSPMEAKRIAWRKGSKPRRDWDHHRDRVMLEALRAKFTQHADLGRLLLETEGEQLVEHTANDRYWGDGGDGSGKNKLGTLLMQVRAELLSSPL